MNWNTNRKKTLLGVVSLLLIAISCGSNGSQSNDPKVSGTITNGGIGNQLLLEYLLPTKASVVDTAIIDEDGNFAFNRVEIKEIGFYRIKQNDRNFITLILEPQDRAVLSSDWNIGIGPYSVTGSPESELLQAINYQMAIMFRIRDSLNMVFQNNQGNQELIGILQSEFGAAGEKNTAFIKSFIKEHPGSFAALAAAEQINPDEDAELLKLVDKELGKNYPNSVYYQEYHKGIAKLDMLAIGSEAPDIILPDKDGNIVKLSSLRGKVVLVDFWASWCKPCRMENPNVVKAFNKYHDKGFEVFGVSLDQSREKWVEAIEVDNLNWTQVSDLKFWSSSVVKLYDIKGIPFALLLDKDGKILAKNLRGQALEQKLEEVLNK